MASWLIIHWIQRCHFNMFQYIHGGHLKNWSRRLVVMNYFTCFRRNKKDRSPNVLFALYPHYDFCWRHSCKVVSLTNEEILLLLRTYFIFCLLQSKIHCNIGGNQLLQIYNLILTDNDFIFVNVLLYSCHIKFTNLTSHSAWFIFIFFLCVAYPLSYLSPEKAQRHLNFRPYAVRFFYFDKPIVLPLLFWRGPTGNRIMPTFSHFPLSSSSSAVPDS